MELVFWRMFKMKSIKLDELNEPFEVYFEDENKEKQIMCFRN